MEYDTMTIGCYALLKRLGTGSFASVYLCEHMKTKQSYAGKLFSVSFAKGGERLGLGWSVIEDEVNILKRLNHHRTIKFEDIVFSPYGVLVIMELVQGRSLIECFPEDGDGFFESFARSLFTQMIEALHYLHNSGIVHRDIKLENVMVEKDGNVKLIDYGLSQYFPNYTDDNENLMVNGLSGSTHYYAPELLRCDDDQKVRGDKTDIWAAGVFLYVLVSGFHPFDGDNDEEIFQEIRSGDISFKDVEFSPELQDLVRMILQKDPERRASIPDILVHPWTLGRKTNLGFTTFHGNGGRAAIRIRNNAPLRASSCSAAFPCTTRKAERDENSRLSHSCSGKFVSENTGKETQIMFPLESCSGSYSYTSFGYSSETEDMGCGQRIVNTARDIYEFLVSWFFPSCAIRRAFGGRFAA